MGIIAKASGGDFELVDAGSYIARCIKMVDIGTQPSWNPDQRPQRKVIITWELLEDEDGERIAMQDGRPFVISETYTISISSKANLRKAIDAWRGIAFTDEEAEGFDITKLLGTYCRIGVTHKPGKKDPSRVYPSVDTVGFTKKKPEGINEISWWSIEDPQREVFDAMPEWLQNRIKQSEEWTMTSAKKQIGTGDVSTKTIDEIAQGNGDEPINLDDIPF